MLLALSPFRVIDFYKILNKKIHTIKVDENQIHAVFFSNYDYSNNI
jgi:hypothetical protein